MILYAMIVRSRDGLILSASTESESVREVKESRTALKLLGKKVAKYPDRCTLRLNPHVIHFITSLGVTFMALCESNYPIVLAFSYLNELMKEFIMVYNTSQINNAVRPYTFIEFDNFVYKMRQRYNSPRTLTTKLNLPDLSTEIKLRPPHLLSAYDIQLHNGRSNGETVVNFSSRITPISWFGIISMTLSSFLVLFNVVRGLVALSESKFEDRDGSNPLHDYPKRRILKTCMSFSLICMCNMLVWTIRDTWQILVHVAVASALTFNIVTRKFEAKAPNYNV
uniref:Longin domain-containing protein n=1 Tax=Strigamia maritima TaxID=126957 RepID=T1J8D3_STRMM